MQNETEVKLFIPRPEGLSLWHGNDARKYASNVIGEEGFERFKTIFNYQSLDNSSQEKSLIRWGTARDCIRLTGVGDKAQEAIEEFALFLRRKVSDHEKAAIKLEMLERSVELTPTDRMSTYRCYYPVIFKKPWKYSRSVERGDVNKVVLTRLIDGIRCQSDQLGIDRPSNLKIALLDVSDPSFVDTEPRWKKSNRADVVLFHTVVFAMNAELKGNWAAGLFVNKGNGRITSVNTVAASDYEVLEFDNV
jgi:hypothetical protein